MTEKLDKALLDLTEMTLAEIEKAKKAGHWSKDFVEGVCIVLSMGYGRWSEHGNQPINNPATYGRNPAGY